jgi:two-component system response regulator AtoC
VLPIHVPPLRERREDIPLLVDHFVKKYSQTMNKKVTGISPKALEMLMNYSWFGNVRELENTIERAIVLIDKDQVEPENLPAEIQKFQDQIKTAPATEEEYSIKKGSKLLEMGLIKKALKKTKGNHTHAARLLEISHRALLYKIKEYGIVEDDHA